MNAKSLASIAAILLSITAVGQINTDFNETAVDLSLTKDADRVGPGLKNGRPSRVMSFGYYSNLNPFNIYSKPVIAETGADTSHVDHVGRMTLKVRAPLYNGEYNKFIIGYKYLVENFEFDRFFNNADYMVNLQNRSLRNMGFTLYSSHLLQGRKFITSRLELAMNGDYKSDHLKFKQVYKLSAALLYGINRNENMSIGAGLYYSQRQGRKNIYPVILYQKNFNETWSVTALLPANATFSKRVGENNFFNGGFEIGGFSYTLVFDKPPVDEFSIAEFRSSSINFPFSWERRIYDFIWIELATGYNLNLVNSIDTKKDKDNTSYVRNTMPGYFFGEASIILGIPRKLQSKL